MAADAHAAADLAEAKRTEYAAYSPVFWRPAEDARDRHLPFLAHCIESERFLALAAEQSGAVVGIALTSLSGAPPPFHADPEPTWFLDDFFVAGGAWAEVGGPLLERIAAEAKRLVVVAAHADRAKCALLEALGFACAASWWVLPVEPAPGEPPPLDGIDAVTGPAPPVYDPGGPTALATRVEPGDAAGLVATFTRWSAASGAVLAIVAARSADAELADALATTGFSRASDWYVG